MASNFYVAEDGTIHRTAQSERTCSRVNNNAVLRTLDSIRDTIPPVHQVSEERVTCFWIISVIISLLIGAVVNKCLGLSFSGGEDDFLYTIAPYVVMIGALAGSIFYGIRYAKDVDYNLTAYFLSGLTALGGIIAAAVAVGIICLIVMILNYAFAIMVAIAIIIGIAEGS